MSQAARPKHFESPRTVRVATYNINDVRKRFDPLRAWLEVTLPDVVCLQELKCTEADFPRDAVRAALISSGHPTILAGDYNVAPTDADIHATRSFKDNALLQPAPRAAYQELLGAGWTDALARQSPDTALCTFWSYLRNRWSRAAGLPVRQTVSRSGCPRKPRPKQQ